MYISAWLFIGPSHHDEYMIEYMWPLRHKFLNKNNLFSNQMLQHLLDTIKETKPDIFVTEVKITPGAQQYLLTLKHITHTP